VSALVYFFADYYPWWGIPIGLILAEVANGHRRRGNRKAMFKYLSVSFIFLGLAAAYIFYNGMQNLRPGMEHMERTIRTK
jgi:hypothetical protein